MEAINLKAELKHLIELEQDSKILQAIKFILQKTTSNSVLKQKLSNRALKAEEDIKNKKTHSAASFKEKTDAFLSSCN